MKKVDDKISHVIHNLALIADDFLINILLLKSKDFQNYALLFLQSHALELSAKCALLELDPMTKITTHNLREIYSEINDKGNNLLSNYLPSEMAFNQYRKLYASQGKNGNTDVILPKNHDEGREWELCYLMENTANLKYGFSKNLEQISVINICYTEISDRFLKLFFACRNVYKNEEIDKILTEKSCKIFGISLFEVYKDHI